MATIHCPAGHIFPDISDPNPLKMYLIRDDQSEEMATRIIEACNSGEDIETLVHYLVVSTGNTIYRCPQCGRLLEFDDTTGMAKSYFPE